MLATTGFWPVKSNLKYTLDYAENPDKTTAEKYLDNDLYSALRYVENDEKTDRKLFVTGINCVTERAYECMTATKKRYGKTTGNLAYHGFQSFAEGEVTPEECHAIGIETAKRMWGRDYEVIVTTHLNTQNHLHNHFVVNSVSFRTGEKFKNKIGDHIELRKISDEICRENDLSVLENSAFYGGEKAAYWAHKAGRITDHDQVKEDAKRALMISRSPDEFFVFMKRLGYEVDETRYSVKSPEWQRAVRLERVGFSKEYIASQTENNGNTDSFYALYKINYIAKPKTTPVKRIIRNIEREIIHSRSGTEVLVASVFLIMIMLIEAIRQNIKYTPLSPGMRLEIQNFKEYISMYNFLEDNEIRTQSQLEEVLTDTEAKISELEVKRRFLYNKMRRADGEEKSRLREDVKELSAQIAPLRQKRNTILKIQDKSAFLRKLIDTELMLEHEAERNKIYDKGR